MRKLLLYFGLFLMILGAIFFLFHCLGLLGDGTWSHYTVGDFLFESEISVPWIQIEWKGIAKITNWILNKSIIALLVLSGSICAFFGAIKLDLD